MTIVLLVTVVSALLRKHLTRTAVNRRVTLLTFSFFLLMAVQRTLGLLVDASPNQMWRTTASCWRRIWWPAP